MLDQLRRIALVVSFVAPTLGAQSVTPATSAAGERRAPALIRVPADAPTIQAGIERASQGDTVLVSPGRYFENIRFLGKGVVVTSEFARSRDLDVVARTIIDGSRPQHPDTGTVVRFVDAEDSTSVLQGFTITGGTGTIWRDAGNNRLYREGGGILCDFSAPVIRFNRIVGNRSDLRTPGVSAVGGGGIRCGFSEPTIEYNVIRENQARYGAGVVLFRSTSVFRHNLVVDNIGGQGLGGAGLWVNGYLTRHRPTVIEHNTIVHNTAPLADSGRRGPQSGTGGGMVLGTIAVLRNNLIWGNTQAGGGPQVATPPTPADKRWFFRFEGTLLEGGLAPDVALSQPPGAIVSLVPEFVDRVMYELTPTSPGRTAGVASKGKARPEVGAYGGAGATRLPR